MFIVLDDTIPRTLEHDKYEQKLIDGIREDLSKNPDIKFNNEDFKKDLEKRLNEYNEKNEKKISCVFTDNTLLKLYLLELCIKANCPFIIQGFIFFLINSPLIFGKPQNILFGQFFSTRWNYLGK
jgi:hypothetical protein